MKKNKTKKSGKLLKGMGLIAIVVGGALMLPFGDTYQVTAKSDEDENKVRLVQDDSGILVWEDVDTGRFYMESRGSMSGGRAFIELNQEKVSQPEDEVKKTNESATEKEVEAEGEELKKAATPKSGDVSSSNKSGDGAGLEESEGDKEGVDESDGKGEATGDSKVSDDKSTESTDKAEDSPLFEALKEMGFSDANAKKAVKDIGALGKNYK